MRDDLLDVRMTLNEKQGALKQLRSMRILSEKEVASLKEELINVLGAQELLQGMADRERDVLQQKIETLVTYGLQAVFGPDYAFKLDQAISRGLVTYDFHLLKGGQSTSLTDAHGGGVLAVVGYLLRVIVILLGGKRRIILLDETFAHVSLAYLPSVAELIRSITDKLEFQHIIVSHSSEFESEADVVYKVKLDGKGHTQVEREFDYERKAS